MCGVDICPVHTRTSERNMSKDNFAMIDYQGEWVLFTSFNTYLLDAIMVGAGQLPYMTMLMKVGTNGALGDLIAERGKVERSIYSLDMYPNMDRAENAHLMLREGLINGIVNPDLPVTISSEIMRARSQRI